MSRIHLQADALCFIASLASLLGGCSIDDNRRDVWRTGPGMLAGQFPADEAYCKNEARRIVAVNRYAYFGEVWTDCMKAQGWQYMGKEKS